MANKRNVREEKEQRFVNPYNFVSLAEKCNRVPFALQEQTFTGKFACELITESPLFIPNTSNDKALHKTDEFTDAFTKTKSYEFFSYQNLQDKRREEQASYEPIIPGSEIRGAVRSVHEAAFNGCLSQVNADKALHRRTMEPKKAGILFFNRETNKIKLQPCERVMLNVTPGNNKGVFVHKNKYKEGDRVFIRKSADEYRKRKFMPYVVEEIRGDAKDDSWIEGYIHIGEYFGKKKHHESVFVPNDNKVHNVSSDEIRRFIKLLEMYLKNEPPHQGYRNYFKGLIQNNFEKIPVYYSEMRKENDSHVAFLSPSNLSNEVFQQTIGDLLKENGSYQPCSCKQAVCPSCALFGFVSEKTEESLASRVRFSDAKLSKKRDDCFLPMVVLPELGEPKPGTVEFYTMREDKHDSHKEEKEFWTYDYKKEDKSRIKLNAKDLKIRGRKFYWHGKPNSEKMEDKLSKMRQRIRPLNKDCYFTFNVFFENITAAELKALQWSLDFNNDECAHKIGRGKPLGYGSVRIQLEELHIRKIDENGQWNKTEYKQKKDQLGIWKESKGKMELDNRLLEKTDQREEILQIASLNPFSKVPISYPTVKGKERSNIQGINETASHQWFTLNKKRGNKKKMLPTIEQELGEDKSLHLYKLFEDYI